MKTFSFENLDVWKVTVDFITALYKVTEKFPDTEKFGLVSQMRRASVSIASNIAEGSSQEIQQKTRHVFITLHIVPQ